MPNITFKPILPAKLFDVALIEREIEAELDKAAKEIKDDFDKAASTWGHKPGFTITRSTWQREITTDDQVFVYVNEGTRPHTILPQGARLAFPGSFVPKTMPGVLGSGGGGSGGKTVFAKEVHHPGTKPRKFDEAVAKLWEPKLAKAIQDAIDRAVKS